ncbi:hypothetical protein, partial [Escherichia coli]|uniref:hypothetical protein n=1 Tax=Escherichia coli TaxID=562 RepID=UPI001BADE39C
FIQQSPNTVSGAYTPDVEKLTTPIQPFVCLQLCRLLNTNQQLGACMGALVLIFYKISIFSYC